MAAAARAVVRAAAGTNALHAAARALHDAGGFAAVGVYDASGPAAPVERASVGSATADPDLVRTALQAEGGVALAHDGHRLAVAGTHDSTTLVLLLEGDGLGALSSEPAGLVEVTSLLALAAENVRLAAVSRDRAHQADGKRSSQLALFSATAGIAASTLDLDTLVAAIAGYVHSSFGCHTVTIYLVDAEAREAFLAGVAGAGTEWFPRGHRVPFGVGIIGWVARHGEHVLAQDVRLEPRFVAAGNVGTRSELAVPVRLAGEVVAVINAESDTVDAFDDTDVVALGAIASQVAAAIRNARLFDEKVRALRRLEIVQEITNGLNSELELDALLAHIARRSVEAVRPARMGAVLLYDGEALGVRSAFGYSEPDALQRVRMPFHEGLPGSVFVSGQGRLVRSALSDYGSQAEAFHEAAGGVLPASALCVPISLPQQKLGVLLLESLAGAETFDAASLRFAGTLADQAAIAIGNALRLARIVEMDRQRQDYLSNVSHELRTPLTVIQGYVEALAGSQATEQGARYARVAGEQCQQLGRMIDEILEVSRLEQGVAQRHLDWGAVALSPVVTRTLQTLRGEAALGRLQLVERVTPDLPPLPGDERLLQMLVRSLLGNAIKFTPPDGRVEVSLEQQGGELVLRVTDTGIGIEPEHQARIFEKFYRVDAGPSRAHAGAGIGLYLAREIVAIHGGSLEVDSQPRAGTCFEVRLPLRPSS